MTDRTSLYVHIPFCVVKCGYCDFNSYAIEDPAAHRRFVSALDRELRTARPPRNPWTVFLGGGTPTYLTDESFARLFEVLTSHIDLAECQEVSMEANPESVSATKATIARQAGVDRISLGVQSFDPARLRFLDRAHDVAAVERAVSVFRDAGFSNLSLDLMFGLPGQTLPQWTSDLERALELRPDHISCYNLTFEPGTRLEHARRQGKVQPNDDRVDAELFQWTRRRLRDGGYEAYEISNFAGRGGPCLHNDHYWLQGDYVGVGPGASSHRAGWRGTNAKPLEAWAGAVERGLSGTAEAEFLTPSQRLGEALWLGLRRRDGIDLDALRERLRIDLDPNRDALIESMVEQGHLRRDGTTIRLAESSLLQADRIAAEFL